MDRDLFILYSTVTGTAEDVALQVSRESQRFHFVPRVENLEFFDIKRLPSIARCLLVISTTGQGDMPDSFKKSWKFLMHKSLPSNSLAGTYYAVFGLGDSSYRNYNFSAKKVDVRLEQLGGQRIVSRGDGDDQHMFGYDGALRPFLKAFFDQLQTLWPSAERAWPKRTRFPPRLHFSVRSDGNDPSSSGLERIGTGAEFTVVANERITAADWAQDVRKITLRKSPPGALRPGDICYLYYENELTKARQFVRDIVQPSAGVSPADVLQSVAAAAPGSESQASAVQAALPCSVEQFFARHVDFNGVPRRSFFDQMCLYAKDERESDRLRYFTSPEGLLHLIDYNDKEFRSVWENLIQFPSVRPGFDELMDFLPAIRARPFSIGDSGASDDGTQFCLYVAVVEHQTASRRVHRGLCSHFF